jgi:hypothetical protein
MFFLRLRNNLHKNGGLVEHCYDKVKNTLFWHLRRTSCPELYKRRRQEDLNLNIDYQNNSEAKIDDTFFP